MTTTKRRPALISLRAGRSPAAPGGARRGETAHRTLSTRRPRAARRCLARRAGGRCGGRSRWRRRCRRRGGPGRLAGPRRGGRLSSLYGRMIRRTRRRGLLRLLGDRRSHGRRRYRFLVGDSRRFLGRRSLRSTRSRRRRNRCWWRRGRSLSSRHDRGSGMLQFWRSRSGWGRRGHGRRRGRSTRGSHGTGGFRTGSAQTESAEWSGHAAAAQPAAAAAVPAEVCWRRCCRASPAPQSGRARPAQRCSAGSSRRCRAFCRDQ